MTPGRGNVLYDDVIDGHGNDYMAVVPLSLQANRVDQG